MDFKETYPDNHKSLNSTKEDIKMKKLDVTFVGEQSQDNGAVTQEFLHLLLHDIFNEERGFTRKLEGDISWFMPAKSEKDLELNCIMGIVVGLSMWNQIVLPVRFPLFLYKILNGGSVNDMDFKETYPDIHKSLNSTKEDIKMKKLDASELELYFSINNGREEVEMIPGGKSKKVTNENFEEYIRRLRDFIMWKSVEKEVEYFKRGFRLFSTTEFRTFSAEEIDKIISGEEVVDWNELRINCRYDGYSANSSTIVMFWENFDELSEEEKRKLLFFLTGSDRAPAGGLSNVHLTILYQKEVMLLPVVHVCSTVMELPDYQNKEKIKEVIKICLINYFGFGVL
jgi:ubiquitin-protein ligase E3 A